MPDEVTLNASGYVITQDAIDRVKNPFLDLDKALDETFYLLEGQYDQIVLEKIFVILNSLSGEIQQQITGAEQNVAAAKRTYDAALEAFNDLQQVGAYGYNEIEALVTILNTYTVSDTFPSKNGSSCQEAISSVYDDILSIVCDLCLEEINKIPLEGPTFTGEANLSILSIKLNAFRTENQSNILNLINNLKTTLANKVNSLEDGEEKNTINAAIDAINTYNSSKNDTNLEAVKEKLKIIEKISDITLSVSDVLSAIANKEACDAAIDAINAYNSSKNDTNLETVKEKLKLITLLKEPPTEILSLVSPVLGNINTYLDENVNNAIKNARAAIDTLAKTKNENNLSAVVNALWDIDIAVVGAETSYYGISLRTTIKATIDNTSELRSRLDGLVTAIHNYNSVKSLTEAPAAFQEIERALNAFSDRDIQTQFNNSTLSGLSDRVDACSLKVYAISTFDNFYDSLNSLLAICQNDAIKNLLLPETDPSEYYNNDASLKEPLTYVNLKILCDILSEKLENILGNVTTSEEALDEAKKVLEELLENFDINANINDLFNLCMMASTRIPLPDDSYRVMTDIERKIDANGNYTYEINYNGTLISKAQYDTSFSKEDGYKHYSLPYFALAIMYEKVGIQQMVLVEQLKQVEKINDAIRENNTALKVLSWLYDTVYGKSTIQSSSGTEWLDDNRVPKEIGMTLSELDKYLEEKAKAGNLGRSSGSSPYKWNGTSFEYKYSSYNRDGDEPGSSTGKNSTAPTTTQNVDVLEQATLTMISNKQDSTRIYGDQLSTDSQLMTTKMSQYMQNSNACVSACTQVVKSVGDYLKTIISNIR
jgi:hypothetical protein